MSFIRVLKTIYQTYTINDNRFFVITCYFDSTVSKIGIADI